RGDTAEVCRVAHAIAKPFDHETMRAEPVMRKLNWIARDAADWRERSCLEWSYERHEFRTVLNEGIDFIGVTIDRDTEALQGRGPVRRKVVAVEMGEAEGTNVR